MSRPATLPLLAVLLLPMLFLRPGAAAAEGLSLELNKLQEDGRGCLATFLIGNHFAQALDRFSLDLFVFNEQGVIADRLLIDLAPLRAGKTTVATFAINGGACNGVSRLLLHDVPACRADGGGKPDCLGGLKLSSRTKIELIK